MKFSVVGDIMLSRLIGQKFEQTSYDIVDYKVVDVLKDSDYVIANLESPILNKKLKNSDHLVFNANSKALKQFDYINFFSLSNNHINDCDSKGIEDSISALDELKFDHNGVFTKEYHPHTFSKNDSKFAIFTCTDMMNIAIKHHYKVPDVNDTFLIESLKEYKSNGYIIIMYAHMGQLFTRFPNPIIRDYARKYCDAGADIVLSVHPHVLGGIEEYNGKKIIYSLGDFVMDGSSFRRRRSCILNFEYSFSEKKFINFEMIPTYVNKNLITILAPEDQKKKAIKSWLYISENLKSINFEKYPEKYKFLYKKEIILHNSSTIRFLIKNIGLIGFLKLLLKRMDEVKMMFKWILTDRSKFTRDDDAILDNRKKFSSKDLFN
jgi:poly-gamma-glutamate capsule biosynthesis protein CapA/YwtB (metallophosphatase superfamily)